MEPSPERLDEYRRLVTDALTNLEADITSLRFNSENLQQLAVAVIYATIIELGTECALLLRHAGATSCPAVLRSILESYADLCATIKDRKYPDRMFVTFLHEKRRLIRDMIRTPGNPFHVAMANSIDPQKELAALDAEIKTFTVRKIYPLTQTGRLEAAGQPELIGGIYWQLCLEAHNNISSLERRHVVKNGDDIELVIFADRRRGEMLMCLDTLLGLLLDAAIRVHGFIDRSGVAKYEAKMFALQALRQTIDTETGQGTE